MSMEDRPSVGADGISESIIELFNDVNNEFYTVFIVPLKQKTLRNVIAIFLFNNFSFKRIELEGILKGVVQRLTFDQLQVFNSSLESLKNKEGGILFVNNYSYTMPINASVLYNRPYPPFKITQSTNNFQYKGALRYLNIKQIVLEHINNLIYDEDDENFANNLVNHVTATNDSKFLNDILDHRKYNTDTYDSLMTNLSNEFKDQPDSDIKKQFITLRDYWSLSNSSDSDDQLKSLGKKVDIIDSSEDEELEMTPENIIKEAKKLLEEVDKLIEQFKYEAISRNTFGKNRRRSYRKRTVTRRRSNKRRSKSRSAPTRDRSNLKSAPTRGRSKKKYCHR